MTFWQVFALLALGWLLGQFLRFDVSLDADADIRETLDRHRRDL